MIEDIQRAQADAYGRGVLNMWIIYDHPKDFPEGYLARRCEIGQTSELGPKGEVSPRFTGDIIIGQLADLRKNFSRCGLVCLTRDPSDDPVIVETWL